MPQNIAIVGSGFLGMTLALRLAESGATVTNFESSDQIGGLASAWAARYQIDTGVTLR